MKVWIIARIRLSYIPSGAVSVIVGSAVVEDELSGPTVGSCDTDPFVLAIVVV